MGLGEAVDAAIPKSHIPSPKSNFLEINHPPKGRVHLKSPMIRADKFLDIFFGRL